jgi:hypothetical protein
MRFVLGAALLGLAFPLIAAAEPTYLGPQACTDCHKNEDAVYKQTKHSNSFREVHRKPAVKDIIAAAGGDTNMRRNATCTACHFTVAKPNASAPAAANAGPSCESCHGAASDWINVHNDYGGPSAKRETETPARKAERIAKATKAGMIRPTMLYDVASNCLSCHGFTRPGVSPETMAKMIDAGHPGGSVFELVKYSQGTIRHRFYPPDINKNAEMTPAELSRMFITGHAASLVSHANAQGPANQKYKDILKEVDTGARAALNAVKDQVPEAAALLAAPTEANARKLIDAIAGKDLSPQVNSLLPAKNTFK